MGGKLIVPPIVRNSFAVVVAANDSSATAKALADYVGDGTADDVQIQAAIDSLDSNGGSVYLAPGNYDIVTPIYLVDNCELFGAGANSILKISDSVGAADHIIITSNSGYTATVSYRATNIVKNVCVHDLFLDGNKYTITSGYAQYKSDDTIVFNATDNITVYNITSKNAGYGWIMTEWCYDIHISNCFDSFSRSGGVVIREGCKRALVEGCTVSHAGYDDKLFFDTGSVAFVVDEVVTGADTTAYATIESVVRTSGDWGAGTAAGYLVVTDQLQAFQDNEVITGSVVGTAVKLYDGFQSGFTAGTLAGAFQEGSAFKALDGVDDVAFSNNIAFNSSGYGLNFYAHAGKGTGSNCVFTGNIIKQCPFGVRVQGAAGLNHRNCSITGNTFDSDLDFKTVCVFVLGVLCSEVTFTGNTITSYGYSMYSSAVAENVIFSNNVCLHPAANNKAAIKIVAVIDNLKIEGNIFSGYEGSTSSSTGLIYLYPADRVSLINNIIDNYQNTALVTFASGTWTKCIIGGNIYDGKASPLYRNLSTAVSDGVYANYLPAGWTCTGNLREGASETVTIAEPTLITSGTSFLDTSSNDITATLPDGLFPGQMKVIIMSDVTSGAGTTVSVSTHETSSPEVGIFDAVGEKWILIWSGTKWITIVATCTI